MKNAWPIVPTCHGNAPRFSNAPPIWSEPRSDEKYGLKEGFRRCSYCGSIHPGDLLGILDATPGARLHGADWKYGWPHKFYVEGVPNLTPGIDCCRGSQWKDGVETLLMGKSSPTLTVKFYCDHLADEGYGDTELAKLLAIIKQQAGIEFSFGERGLMFKAPHHGYQR